MLRAIFPSRFFVVFVFALSFSTPFARGADPPSAGVAATAPATQGLSGTEIYHRMLPSTVWLRVEWNTPQGVAMSWGTGWVYDVGRRLVVTNEHVVHGFDEMTAFFPETVDGELQHEPNYYLEHGQRYVATVIDRDTARDLALVQLDRLPPEAVSLKLADNSPEPGERVFALASLPQGSEGLWIATSGEVRQVYRRSNANRHFERVVETQLPTNCGNSGGAVVNDRLDVVAVVEGHMIEARLVSMFVDVGEIRDYLSEAAPLCDAATPDELQTRASRRFDEGRYDPAIADYTAALRIDPKIAAALMNRGWAFQLKGDNETAIADFDAALTIDPEMRGAYEGRGTCYREMGDYPAAVRDLTEAIRRDSTDADTFERRAKCYHRQEKYDLALQDRNRAVELAPDDVTYMFGRGQTYRALKRFRDAQSDFERAIALQPATSESYYELAWVFFDEENYDQARIFFSAAVDRNNQAAEYWNMRGLTYLRQEQYEPAIQDFAQALRLNPESGTYHWHTGLAMWYMDRYDEAAQSFSQVIRLAPDDPDGYRLRADVYEAMERNDLAAADRAKMKKLQAKQNK